MVGESIVVAMPNVSKMAMIIGNNSNCHSWQDSGAGSISLPYRDNLPDIISDADLVGSP